MNNFRSPRQGGRWGVESRHEGRRHPPGLPRVHDRNRPCGDPPRAPDPPRRPDHAVHRQRHAAAAAVPARRRPPRGAPASPTARPACASRTSTRSATTGTRPSSRCSATGASATTSSRSSCRRCGPSSPRRSGSTPTGSTSRASSATRPTASPRTPSPPRSGRGCSPRPASAPTRSSSTPRSTPPRSGTDGARIAFYGKKNWWCRGGDAEYMPVGEPGGPDSELFYLYPEIEHDPAYGANCHQNCDCGRFIEIGNSVFMEYQRTETGFEPLPRKNVDYGGGLARIAAASIDSLRRLPDQPALADHREAAGAVRQVLRGRDRRDAGHRRPPARRDVPRRRRRPAEQQGPGLRDAPADPPGGPVRVRPRAASRTSSRRSSRRSPASTTTHYPEVGERARLRRRRAGQGGAGVPPDACARASSSCAATGKTGVTGAELFTLYDTFGFPVELSTEEAQRAGIAVSEYWREEFDAQMAEQRARSQQATKSAG